LDENNKILHGGYMKTVLITGFDPFGGETVNPALEAVMQLPDEIDDIKIIKLELPTVFGKSADILCRAIADEQPDVVISVGQAGGRAGISLERVAVNINDADIRDNEGNQPIDTPILGNSAVAYFSTLPIKTIVSSLHKKGIPASVSDSAGTFVCNHVMYAALNYAAVNNPMMKAGFVHIPYTPAQAIDKPAKPSMSTVMVVDALTVVIINALYLPQN